MDGTERSKETVMFRGSILPLRDLSARIAAADGGAYGLTNRTANTPAAHSREHAPADSSPSPVLASDAVASLTTTDTQTRQDLSASNRGRGCPRASLVSIIHMHEGMGRAWACCVCGLYTVGSWRLGVAV